MVIIDANSFLNLSKKSAQALNDAVRDDGLGVFIQSETNLFNSSSKALKFQFIRSNTSKTTLDEWPNMTLDKFRYNFLDDSQIEAVHTNDNKIITGYKRIREGRIGTSLVRNTYQLLLEGQNSEYQQFWADVITGFSKRKVASTEWNNNVLFAFQNQPYSVYFRSIIEKPQLILNRRQIIPLAQDPDIKSVWKGITYPSKKAWNRLSLANDTISRFDFYTLDTTQWKSLRDYNTIFKIEGNSRNLLKKQSRKR